MVFGVRWICRFVPFRLRLTIVNPPENIAGCVHPSHVARFFCILIWSFKQTKEAIIEEREYKPMTRDEMQRFLNLEAKDGKSELEAYKNLMYILGIEFPKIEKRQ